MALVTDITLALNCSYTNALDLSTVTDALAKAYVDSLATGTGLDQSDVLWHDRRTLASAGTENLDLAGVLTNSFGATATFVKVKLVLIINRSTTAGEKFVIGGHATAAWEGWTTVAGSKITVGPNGFIALYNPSLAGMAVTATTGDLLKVENTGSNSNIYDVVIIGTSA